MVSRIDLHSYKNDGCEKKCTKSFRDRNLENDLCTKTLSSIDELPVRCVGQWAEHKIYILYQYFGIFSKGMKNSWKEINYIEICSGPGRCINRYDGIEIDGTALSILKHKDYINIKHALFFDYDSNIVNVLNLRIDTLKIHNAKAYIGDYNNPQKICDILDKEIDISRSLNLVFIDPTDCSVPFILLKSLKSLLRNVDFIINIATGTDFNRNIPMAFKDRNRASKYERFLDNSNFFLERENIDLCEKRNFLELRNKFREAYEISMKKIGYKYFDFKRIEHYYDILFAAGHEKAIEFWNKAQKIRYDGQRNLF